MPELLECLVSLSSVSFVIVSFFSYFEQPVLDIVVSFVFMFFVLAQREIPRVVLF
jgi:hypothetical protein